MSPRKKDPGKAGEAMDKLRHGEAVTQTRPQGEDGPAGTVGVMEPGLAPGESPAVSEPEPGALEAQIDSLGESVRQHEGATGGYEIGEAAHQSAIERMEALGDELTLDPVSLVADVRDFLLDVIKSRPKPWSASSPAEQRDVAAACEQLAEGLVRGIIEVIRSDGKKPVRVLLQKVTLGDEIQVVGKVKTFEAEEEDQAVTLLHHARGKHVMLTVASVDDYKGNRPAAVDVEEPALPFEGGDHPDDDSDLAGEDRPAGGEDRIDTEHRVNLKSGWVQRRDPTHPPEADAWLDVREATPFELSAERDRVADFDDRETGSDAETTGESEEAAVEA